MKADEKQELLRAIAKAKGVSVQQVYKQMAERYAETYATEIMGAEGVEAALKPLRQRRQEQQDKQQKTRSQRQKIEQGVRQGKTRQEAADALGLSPSQATFLTGKLRNTEANEKARRVAWPLLKVDTPTREVVTALQASGDKRNRSKLAYVVRQLAREVADQQAEAERRQANRQAIEKQYPMLAKSFLRS